MPRGEGREMPQRLETPRSAEIRVIGAVRVLS